jgi:hypothetical protein
MNQKKKIVKTPITVPENIFSFCLFLIPVMKRKAAIPNNNNNNALYIFVSLQNKFPGNLKNLKKLLLTI